jgi:hypothetical protein
VGTGRAGAESSNGAKKLLLQLAVAEVAVINGCPMACRSLLTTWPAVDGRAGSPNWQAPSPGGRTSAADRAVQSRRAGCS